MIGYGNSMFLATHGILARTASGGGVDPDAQAFITAASITDPTQQSAINTLVTDLKGYNIWTKMKALYPFVGGTASTHKWNLKDPRDLDVAFRLTFVGGLTHSSTGIKGNGTNGYFRTYLLANTDLPQNTNASGAYIRTNVAEDTIDYGFIASSGHTISSRLIGNLFRTRNFGNAPDISNSDSRGFYQTTRRNSSGYVSVKNTTKTTNTITSVVSGSNIESYGLACNFVGPNFYSSRELAFHYYANSSLSDTELDNLYTAVQAFQVTLGRSIGTQTVSDADAQAFVTNAGIVDQVEANAVNNLVIGLKADSLWTKMQAIYPMVGGTNTSNSYNLRNTAEYQISWVGGVTSSNNGVQFGGVNGYGNTGIIPSSVSTLNSTHMSFYSRTTYNNSGVDDFGAYVGINQIQRLMIKAGSLNDHTVDMNSTSERVSGTVTVPSGFFLANRETSTALRSLRNNVSLGSNTNTNTGTLPNIVMFLGALNNAGSAVNYSVRECAFASYGNGLTTTDETNLYSRVQTFNTALNRNV